MDEQARIAYQTELTHEKKWGAFKPVLRKCERFAGVAEAKDAIEKEAAEADAWERAKRIFEHSAGGPIPKRSTVSGRSKPSPHDTPPPKPKPRTREQEIDLPDPKPDKSGKEPIGAKVPTEQVVEWVADNLGKAVTRRDAPSESAWNMMQWAKESQTSTDKFWTLHYAKLMPNQKELERRRRMLSGDEQVRDLINRTMEQFRARTS